VTRRLDLDHRTAPTHTECEQCQKRAWTSKAAARAATRKAHNRIRLYQCPFNRLHWHVTDDEKASHRG
jgi:exoribonuclease R